MGKIEKEAFVAAWNRCKGEECVLDGWGPKIREAWVTGGLEPGVTGSEQPLKFPQLHMTRDVTAYSLGTSTHCSR